MTHAFARNAAHPLRACAGIVLACCAAFVTPAICAAAAPTATAVEIKKFAFTQKEITVAPGTKITWTNRDETPHTVTSTDKSFGSKGLDTDDKFEHTFATEGDFSYFCTLHPYMTGIVHVRKQSPDIGAKSSPKPESRAARRFAEPTVPAPGSASSDSRLSGRFAGS